MAPKKPTRKAGAMGMDRDARATALLNASTTVAKAAKGEGAKSGGLRQSMKASDTAETANKLFGKALGTASQSARVKAAGARMGRAQGMQAANRAKLQK